MIKQVLFLLLFISLGCQSNQNTTQSKSFAPKLSQDIQLSNVTNKNVIILEYNTPMSLQTSTNLIDWNNFIAITQPHDYHITLTSLPAEGKIFFRIVPMNHKTHTN